MLMELALFPWGDTVSLELRDLRWDGHRLHLKFLEVRDGKMEYLQTVPADESKGKEVWLQ